MAAALRYADGMSAPIVVAKGRGLVAEEIVRRAGEHGVAIHVSNNLAALLMQVDIDHAIPPQLFQAVAQLLAWLYRLEERAAPASATVPR
jgi:flagellar biosynthesis protein